MGFIANELELLSCVEASVDDSLHQCAGAAQASVADSLLQCAGAAFAFLIPFTCMFCLKNILWIDLFTRMVCKLACAIIKLQYFNTIITCQTMEVIGSQVIWS